MPRLRTVTERRSKSLPIERNFTALTVSDVSERSHSTLTGEPHRSKRLTFRVVLTNAVRLPDEGSSGKRIIKPLLNDRIHQVVPQVFSARIDL